MTSAADFVQPPRVATWLVNLFTSSEEESITGDLQEEFSQLAKKSGLAFARRWYWRQTLKTIAHLFGSAFRVAQWSTTAVVVGGFFLLPFVSQIARQGTVGRYRQIPRLSGRTISRPTCSGRRTEC